MSEKFNLRLEELEESEIYLEQDGGACHYKLNNEGRLYFTYGVNKWELTNRSHKEYSEARFKPYKEDNPKKIEEMVPFWNTADVANKFNEIIDWIHEHEDR